MNPLENIKLLKNGGISEQVSALNALKEFFLMVVVEALDALRLSPNPLLIAERIFSFGSIAVEPLEKLFFEISSGDLKVIVSALLVQLGSSVGIKELLVCIETGNEFQHLAATSLAKADVQEACPYIIKKLESLEKDFYQNRENAPFVNTFLVALQQLDYKLPTALKEKFTSPGVPPDISNFIK